MADEPTEIEIIRERIADCRTRAAGAWKHAGEAASAEARATFAQIAEAFERLESVLENQLKARWH
jgi:hypothetical protein